MGDLEDKVLPHLRTQFERGRAILFTGAGFSGKAINLEGEPLPIGRKLAENLWRICFPSDPFDASASLQDIYEAALAKNPKGLKDLLTRCLTVDANSIEDWLTRYYTLSWYRIYTLNIDDLAAAVSRRVPLRRSLVDISATNATSARTTARSLFSALEVIYLNGSLADVPDNVTFSSSQYSRRLVYPDHLYQKLVADLVSRPVVFVGTRLDEPSLWQNVEIRRTKGQRGMRELRPRSYLVTPNLDRARESRLSEFNIRWLKMTAEEFSDQVLRELIDASETGLKVFTSEKVEADSATRLREVGDLAIEPHRTSEFLLGQEPIWADIQSERAIARACDKNFWKVFQSSLSVDGLRGIIVLTGTAGSGKSTCLMRLALRYAADGHRIAWIDRTTDLPPHRIISGMKNDDAPGVIAIDDADMFGWSLSAMLRDIASLERQPLVIVAVRSGRVDRVINGVLLRDLPVKELAVPHLDDSDIDSLIQTLDRENRLGALKGKSLSDQRAMFKEYAGRQLLVAMISATSGAKFQEKVPDEFFGLAEDMQQVYALICLGTTFRFSLSRQEILIALNDSTNETLNTVEQLLQRHIIIENPPGSGLLQARHRVIAELIRDELQARGQLKDSVFGLAFLATTNSLPGSQRSARAFILLRFVINHDFLYRTIGLDASQLLYQNLEDLLSSNSHYWLQRGSLEVEFGDLKLAENFLSQARGLSCDDLLIENEWAYLLFRKALENPRAVNASELVREATHIITSITIDPRSQPHPFHVLGSQGLAWSRVGILGAEEKERYLRELVSRVQIGIERYPKNPELQQLRDDLRREYLMIAVK